MKTATEEYTALVLQIYRERYRKGRENVERITALDLAKQMRAAEMTIYSDPKYADLVRRMKAEIEEENRAPDQTDFWERDAAIAEFESNRAKFFDD